MSAYASLYSAKRLYGVRSALNPHQFRTLEKVFDLPDDSLDGDSLDGDSLEDVSSLLSCSPWRYSWMEWNAE